MRTLSALPPWLMITIGFVFFAAISAGCRFALSRVASPERSAQAPRRLRRQAAQCVWGDFRFPSRLCCHDYLVGGECAGQDAVDLQASSAQQLSWATSAIQDQAGAAEVNGNLCTYRDTVVNKDGPAFADADFSALPSAKTSSTL